MNELLSYSDIDAPRDGVNDDGDIIPIDSEPQYISPPTNIFDHRLVGSIETTESGPSVTLADRAATLTAIMAYYNKRSMTRGSKKQLSVPDSKFKARYENPEDVQAGAERKVRDLYSVYMQGIATLAAVDSPYETSSSGTRNLHPDVVDIKHELNEAFLDGNSNATERHKVVTTARRVAKIK